MTTPVSSPVTFRLGQGPKFKPLPSARRRRAFTAISDLREWVANLPGETFGNEILVPATGAWPNVFLQPPRPLTEVLRLTLPRPEPLTLTIHPWSTNAERFRRATRRMAHVNSNVGGPFDPLDDEGRVFIEWGTGRSRNWTYVDAGPGSLQIPMASHLRVSAWCRTVPFIIAASAEPGYSHGGMDCTWTAHLAWVGALANWPTIPPHFAREITGYIYSTTELNAVGQIELGGANLSRLQLWEMRPAITPNPPPIPYPPVKVPLSGGVSNIFLRTVANVNQLDVTAVVNVRI